MTQVHRSALAERPTTHAEGGVYRHVRTGRLYVVVELGLLKDDRHHDEWQTAVYYRSLEAGQPRTLYATTADCWDRSFQRIEVSSNANGVLFVNPVSAAAPE